MVAHEYHASLECNAVAQLGNAERVTAQKCQASHEMIEMLNLSVW